jgi:hypothetical protein
LFWADFETNRARNEEAELRLTAERLFVERQQLRAIGSEQARLDIGRLFQIEQQRFEADRLAAAKLIEEQKVELPEQKSPVVDAVSERKLLNESKEVVQEYKSNAVEHKECKIEDSRLETANPIPRFKMEQIQKLQGDERVAFAEKVVQEFSKETQTEIDYLWQQLRGLEAVQDGLDKAYNDNPNPDTLTVRNLGVDLLNEVTANCEAQAALAQTRIDDAYAHVQSLIDTLASNESKET